MAKRYRHRKRGTEYLLLGAGKVQAQDWISRTVPHHAVDMSEVAIYRSVHDGSLWARPIAEFHDGRFEPVPGDSNAVDDIALIREALLDTDIACFPDFTAAVGCVCDEVERFQSERSYIVGHNDGWRDALRQEVFAGTVETDSRLEAAARQAGWALMELVDEIDFRKREEVSEIASRLAKALLAADGEPDCPTCGGTGKEARHQLCRDCDEVDTPSAKGAGHVE